jgi:putative ABC transport system permease protein
MWRNRGRTILSASAVFFSTLIVCFVLALETGYIDDMIANIRYHVTGDIRIMHRDYLLNERISPLQFFIDDTEAILTALAGIPGVASATPRTEFGVSIYRNGEQIPTRAIGIDFASSPLLSSPNNRITRGSAPAPGSSGILVSKGLADELGLVPGSKITAITRTAISGSNGKTFTVSGVISMADTDFSGRVFFLDWRTAGEYLRMGQNALQIQVFLKDRSKEDAIVRTVTAELAKRSDNLDATLWHKVSGMYGFLEMAGIIYAIYGAIFYALAGTVIFNTTMMSVLERKKEIGTLGALGMGSGRIIRLFVTESALIASLGTTAGLIVGGSIVAITGRIGFDMQALYGSDMKGFSFSRMIYPSLAPSQYALIFCMGVIISLAACALPARMAAAVEPADALADR